MEKIWVSINKFEEKQVVKPDKNLHSLAVRIAGSRVSLLLTDKEKRKILGCEILGLSDKPELANSELLGRLFDDLRQHHPWFSNPEIAYEFLIPHDAFVLVPEKLYDSFYKEQYLEYQTVITSEDTVSADKIGQSGIQAVYALPATWKQWLNYRFNDPVISHDNVHWISNFMHSGNKRHNDIEALILADNSKVGILVKEGQNLLYFNEFRAESHEDVLYYFTAALTEASVKSLKIINLAGEMASDPALFGLISSAYLQLSAKPLPYFSNIPKAMRALASSQLFRLFNIVKCG